MHRWLGRQSVSPHPTLERPFLALLTDLRCSLVVVVVADSIYYHQCSGASDIPRIVVSAALHPSALIRLRGVSISEPEPHFAAPHFGATGTVLCFEKSVRVLPALPENLVCHR